MIAEIVAIGTELLMGQIADSDAQMLSRELQSLGIAVYHHQVVGDNPQRMREALALALSRSGSELGVKALPLSSIAIR